MTNEIRVKSEDLDELQFLIMGFAMLKVWTPDQIGAAMILLTESCLAVIERNAKQKAADYN